MMTFYSKIERNMYQNILNKIDETARVAPELIFLAIVGAWWADIDTMR